MCGKKTFRDIKGIFKKVNFIYIYIYRHTHTHTHTHTYECKWMCCKEKKKTKLAFQIERSIRPGEEKQIQARKFSQFKSVKALAIAW